ncbi:RASEF protein, partial [Anhinga anhinga]|nr:RASEF protein [Anhinga anhinga]
LRGHCCEDAVPLQGAAGPAGDGGGGAGIRKLHQDAAVHLTLARQWQGSSRRGSQGCAPSWGVPLLWVQPSLGLRMLSPARMINSSLRSALLLRCRQTCQQSPAAAAPMQEGRGGPGPAPTRAAGEGRDAGGPPRLPSPCWGTKVRDLPMPSTLGWGEGHRSACPQLLGSGPSPWHPAGTHPPTGKAEGPRCSARHLSKRKLPAFAPEVTGNSPSGEEPAPPCPMYQLVLAGDGSTGKPSFLLRLCMNEFRGNISSILTGVDFQIKQLLVDGEQATLQTWDTAGQER